MRRNCETQQININHWHQRMPPYLSTRCWCQANKSEQSLLVTPRVRVMLLFPPTVLYPGLWVDAGMYDLSDSQTASSVQTLLWSFCKRLHVERPLTQISRLAKSNHGSLDVIFFVITVIEISSLHTSELCCWARVTHSTQCVVCLLKCSLSAVGTNETRVKKPGLVNITDLFISRMINHQWRGVLILTTTVRVNYLTQAYYFYDEFGPI